MSPLAISATAFSRLIFDQMLLLERETNLCSQVSSLLRLFLSVDPPVAQSDLERFLVGDRP